ncbi:MAG: hypothetical protein ACK5U8_14515, partial [Deltaproteobacteria bacterium]
MSPDLHQGPAPRPRRVAGWLAGASGLLCALSLAGAPRRGAQAPREAGVPTATPLRGPATCAIDGRAAIT